MDNIICLFSEFHSLAQIRLFFSSQQRPSLLRTEKSLQKKLAGFAQFFLSLRIKTKNGRSKSHRISLPICNAKTDETATIYNGMDCILLVIMKYESSKLDGQVKSRLNCPSRLLELTGHKNEGSITIYLLKMKFNRH